ncbi:hypothetical protein QBZ16_002014 [Prototheca wickerhamii]|uniref:Uncharacterized protein n=1 Tax=Prototheca wickerhamii TaxID=3111 RepID=A0AAD9MI51_PROWI|nr:hypothetical protein QBZ16_002014 [Prototheca wickerhamii]
MVVIESYPCLPDLIEYVAAVYDQMRTLHRADPMRVECPESLAPETKLFCSPTVIDDRIVVQ